MSTSPTILSSTLTLPSLSSTITSILLDSASYSQPPSTSSASQTKSAHHSHHTPEPEASSLYFYKPSIPPAAIFSVLFFLLIPYHFYLSIYVPLIAKSVHQGHRYTIPLFIAAVIATLGFSLRIASISSVSGRASIPLYANSSTYIIIAPIFICATLYLLITHLIRLCLPEGRGRVFLGISPRWFGRIFIGSDILSFLSQCAGSGIAASGNWEGSQEKAGTAVLIFGLAAQLATFTVYMIVFWMFWRRVYKGRSSCSATTTEERQYGFNPLVKQVMRGVTVANLCIQIRSIYRLVEFGTGIDGYFFNHEWALYVFEAVPVWIALLVLAYYHPVKWLQQKPRDQLADKNFQALQTVSKNRDLRTTDTRV